MDRLQDAPVPTGLSLFWTPARCLATHWGWSRLRAHVDRALGDPDSARRHARAANRALVGIRVLLALRRGCLRIGRVGHKVTVSAVRSAREVSQ